MRHRSISFSSLLALLLLFGCSDDGDASGDGESSSGAEGESSGTSGPDLDALYACVDPSIFEARPLIGPGYDPAMGGLLAPMQEQYVVSSTQILVKPEALGDFMATVDQVTAELDTSAGMVAYSLALEPTCGFARTISVWRSEADMVAFAVSDAHVMAAGRTQELAVTGKVTHWSLAAAAFPPSWDEARAQLAMVTPLGGG